MLGPPMGVDPVPSVALEHMPALWANLPLVVAGLSQLLQPLGKALLVVVRP